MRVCILLMLWALSMHVFSAGIQNARVVYEEKKGVFATNIISEDIDETLIKVWLENGDGKKLEGVVVAPSLFVMPAKSKRRVKILNLNSVLVSDKEVLAYINILSLPAKVESAAASAQLALQARFKFFLRPESMKSLLLKDAVGSLRWSVGGGKLQVVNSSPFHIVLAGIQVGEKTIDVEYLDPKSTRSFEVAIPKNLKVLSLKYIGDDGVYSSPIKFSIY